jgi:flagellar hook-basal body complex protein FliE
VTVPISTINPIPMPAAPSSVAGAGSGSSSFGDVLSSTMDQLGALQQNAGTAAQKFMSGENEDVHTVALAAQQSELAFELGLQVRNKVVSAYQEVMKMQL